MINSWLSAASWPVATVPLCKALATILPATHQLSNTVLIPVAVPFSGIAGAVGSAALERELLPGQGVAVGLAGCAAFGPLKVRDPLGARVSSEDRGDARPLSLFHPGCPALGGGALGPWPPL